MNIPVRAEVPLFELDMLKTLVAIAETGNFSAAADVVHRTPSAVSMQVKRMEEILGRPLFVRDSRSVNLTMDGEQLLVHARRLLALNREMMSKFITPDVTGEVRFGAVDHMAEHFLPSVLKRFNCTHPGITVDVTVETSKELARRLRAGQLDLAMVTSAGDNYDGLGLEVVYSEKLVWAGLKGGIAHEQDPLPITIWEEGCVWREAALRGLEKQNRRYRISFKSAYIAGQKSAVMADLAVAPLPEAACGGDIVVLGDEVGLPELSEYKIGLISGENFRAPHEAFVDHLRASFAQLVAKPE